MSTRTTNKKTTAASKSTTSNALILKDLCLQLLTPEQFEAITEANYYHSESRLILQLFLQANYTWQLARKLQNKPSAIDTIDWSAIENTAAKLITESLSKLLAGVNCEPWKPEAAASLPASKPATKTRSTAQKQACGCTQKHSAAAGVVEACRLGKAQGRDESWTGY